MSYAKLKGRMREKNITQDDIASILEISMQSVNAKLNGRSSFTIPEAQRIAEVLELENPGEYFFTHNVPKMQQNQ